MIKYSYFSLKSQNLQDSYFTYNALMLTRFGPRFPATNAVYSKSFQNVFKKSAEDQGINLSSPCVI